MPTQSSMLTLMCKDIPVVRFGYDVESRRVFARDAALNPSFAPLLCTDAAGIVTTPGLQKLMRGRAIPRERDGRDEAIAELGYASADGFLLANLALSLTDQYWVRPDGCDLAWSDVNFFENDFDDRLGRVIAAKHPSSAARLLLGGKDPGLSPDASTHGNLKKRWTIDADGTRTLLKSARRAYYNQEPYNEAVATALCRRILAPGDYVPYEVRLERDDEGADTPVSACPTMATASVGFEPYLGIMDKEPGRTSESPFDRAVGIYQAHGIADAAASLEKMLVVDYILENSDRHWNNLGILIDADTREWLRVAPLFDFGSSLWHDFDDVSQLPPCHSRVQRLPFLQKPDEQIRYLRDLSWLDTGALDGFADEAIGILETNALLARLVPRRLEATRLELERRCEKVKTLAMGHTISAQADLGRNSGQDVRASYDAAAGGPAGCLGNR